MKTLYTSNYAMNGKNPDAIGISFIVPAWFQGKTITKVAPTLEMISKTHGWVRADEYDVEEYTKDYINLLESRNINPQDLVDEIPDGAILLCYERPDEFCHRHVLAEWVQSHTGVIVTECKSEKEIKVDNRNKMVDSLVDF